MPPKSIFRQSGAKHFQLVHRSQRDPLIHDAEASRHVLKPFERENVKKGKSRTDLESILALSHSDHDRRTNIGEAALYGVLYDDAEYDYMQHLRQVGEQEDGVESILIEAPSTSRKSNAKGRKESISLRDLPSEVLAPTFELPRNYESEEAIPSSIAGFQPDMDPHLRQVLEALEDDAFVDDEIQDDFFQELVVDGERKSDEDVEFEFHDDIHETIAQCRDAQDGWEARFERFKKEQKTTSDSRSGSDCHSEGEDVLGQLPESAVMGGKRRRKRTSDASGYSMSSSSLYRTEALQTLDECFDQMILREYASEDGDDSDDVSSEDSDTAPQLLTSREDFKSMVDDFLDNYEILGSRMKPKLPGDSGVEKLEALRTAMGQDERVRVRGEDSDEDNILVPFEDVDVKDRWDCETILTTYSNVENHPRLIRARDTTAVPKIRLHPRTGLPTPLDESRSVGADKLIAESISEYSDLPTHIPVARPRGESKDDKKARKQAVKEERQARRVSKKATKDQFLNELKQQKKLITNNEKPKMRKL